MLVSYVLRLVDSAAAQGHLVGEIENVRTGDTRVFRNATELAQAVRDSQAQLLTDPLTTEATPWPGDPDHSSD